MKIAHSRVTAQGQISVPAEVRRRLELTAGSVLEWDARGDDITIRRAGEHSSEDVHQTLFAKAPHGRTLEELKQGVHESVRKRHARG